MNGATAHPHYESDGTTYNMGNSYGKHGKTGLWAGYTGCFLLLLQGAVVGETSVSKETLKLLFLFVSKRWQTILVLISECQSVP